MSTDRPFYACDFESADNGDEHDDASLAAAMASELNGMPWYVVSVVLHTLIFMILFLIPPDRRNDDPYTIKIVECATLKKIMVDDPQPEFIKDRDEIQKIFDDIDTPVKDPVVIPEAEIDIADEPEDDNDAETEGSPGDPENIALAPSETTGPPAAMGVAATGATGGGSLVGNRIRGRRRLGRKFGFTPREANAVAWALRWLKAHQEYDGHWDARKYGAEIHGGSGEGLDAAVTALAILAFLGDGNSLTYGKYRDNVRRGVDWLIRQQQANGVIGEHRYVGGITLMAIVEAYGMEAGGAYSPEAKKEARRLRPYAQKAVDWAVESQCPAGGWNYTPTAQRNDTSVAGWWIMGLKSAKVVGLNVPYETMAKALKYIQKATTPGDYDNPSSGSVSYKSITAAVDGVTAGGGSIRLTAVALTCLQFLGRPRTDGQVIGCADRSMGALPNSGGADFYLWYYQALGLLQMGAKSDYWKKFCSPIRDTLTGSQIKNGDVQDRKGSWDPDETYGKYWGRVGGTALGALMLEVYYRYGDVHKNERR